MKERSIAVIGGGLAGLTAAYVLGERGARCVVFEAENRLGGRAMTDDLDGFEVDPGAQLFGSMYTRFLGLTRELGLGDRLVRVPGRDALWRNGRAHEVVYGSVASMITSGGLPIGTKMRLGATYVPFLNRHAGDLQVGAPERYAAAGLDDETIAAWGERELDREFVRSLAYPQLAAFYGALPEETSAGFYHVLARYGLDISLYAVDGGVGKVAECLADRVRATGGEMRLGTTVRSIRLTTEGVVVTTDAGEDSFQNAVAAIPAPALRPLLEGAPEKLTDWLDLVRFRPSVVLALVTRTPADQRFFGLSFPRGTMRYLAAVAVAENKGVPGGDAHRGVLLALPSPEAAASFIEMESRAILERLLPEIAVAFPGIESRLVRVRGYRWPQGAPTFYPGYARHLGEFRRNPPDRGSRLVLAGDYLYGPTVEGAVLSGYAAAGRLAPAN